MSSEIPMLAAALSGLERIQKLEISKAPESPWCIAIPGSMADTAGRSS